MVPRFVVLAAAALLLLIATTGTGCSSLDTGDVDAADVVGQKHEREILPRSVAAAVSARLLRNREARLRSAALLDEKKQQRERESSKDKLEEADFMVQADATCVACPAGTYGNCSEFETDPCPRGSCPNVANCTACPAGSSSGGNATHCLTCFIGWIAPEPASLCTPCPAGESSSPKKDACFPCPAGYFAPYNGSTCRPCPEGASTEGFNQQQSCQLCSGGSYNDAPGMGYCTDCGSGWYGEQAGATSSASCRSCPAGSYCPTSVTTDPVPCPAGSYCPAGSTQPAACTALFDSPVGAFECTPTGGFYGLLFGTVGAVCVGAWIGGIMWRRRRRGASGQLLSRNATATGLDSQRLIPRPTHAPVYDGL